jgi:hypothetical protein
MAFRPVQDSELISQVIEVLHRRTVTSLKTVVEISVPTQMPSLIRMVKLHFKGETAGKGVEHYCQLQMG